MFDQTMPLSEIEELRADRDRLARDLAMRPHELKLAYDCREALGFNKYTSLSILPGRIKELVAENARLKAALAAAAPRLDDKTEQIIADVIAYRDAKYGPDRAP